MRYLPAVAVLAAAMLAAPLLADEATPPAAPPAPKKVVCSETFETGSLVKSHKRCSKVGKRTELFARFSTVAGGAGSVDTPRDVRGFAVKFYTDEGNWDL